MDSKMRRGPGATGTTLLGLLALVAQACGPSSPPQSLAPAKLITCGDWNGRPESEQRMYAAGLTHGVIFYLLQSEQWMKGVREARKDLKAGEVLELAEEILSPSIVLGEMRIRCAKRPELELVPAAVLAVKTAMDEISAERKKENK